jgi:hypothetical protein
LSHSLAATDQARHNNITGGKSVSDPPCVLLMTVTVFTSSVQMLIVFAQMAGP